MDGDRSEVKGSWFVTGRAYLLREGGDGLLQRVGKHLADDRRPCLFEPIASLWYPEEDLQCVLSGVRSEVALGSSGRFLTCMEGCTEIGINRFFRVLLRLTSTPFVLRQVPTMWRQIRRGAGTVEVEERDGVIVVRYSAFPYFADENYRIMTQGSLMALVAASTGERPDVHIEDFGADWLNVTVTRRR